MLGLASPSKRVLLPVHLPPLQTMPSKGGRAEPTTSTESPVARREKRKAAEIVLPDDSDDMNIDENQLHQKVSTLQYQRGPALETAGPPNGLYARLHLSVPDIVGITDHSFQRLLAFDIEAAYLDDAVVNALFQLLNSASPAHGTTSSLNILRCLFNQPTSTSRHKEATRL